MSLCRKWKWIVAVANCLPFSVSFCRLSVNQRKIVATFFEQCRLSPKPLGMPQILQTVSVTKTTHTLHQIPLYLVDSVIQLLNNQGQYEKDFNMMGSCRSALFPTLQFFICFTWKLLAVSCLFFCSTLGPIIFSPRFQAPHCNFKTFCCLNTKNDVQNMIYFFGRDL